MPNVSAEEISCYLVATGCKEWRVRVRGVYAPVEIDRSPPWCGERTKIERGLAHEGRCGRAHRHLGGAMRSPHPPKQDRVSHGIRQEESQFVRKPRP